ncbi:MAG TPA: phosphoribosylglycinamide formyltransferase [Planctomycetota bacterium]|jgi:formyltetrahydrofolate-dependent phosphoribosylglycinamide formyltransferase|nr:phosphoribosylglycinamide formyltransferase [Planctomycetota bacterium]
MKNPVRLGVLLSGSGRTLQNLMDRIEDGSLPAKISVVVSSHPGVKGLDRARAGNIPAATVDYKTFPGDKAFSAAVTQELEKHPVDLVILAGFIRRYLYPSKFEGRVLNIHPALLPEFGGKGYYGHRVHEAVLRSGAKESGCTVHLADLEYDRGQILLQKRVPVLPGDTPDTLAARVFEAECDAYPEAIRRMAEVEVR